MQFAFNFIAGKFRRFLISPKTGQKSRDVELANVKINSNGKSAGQVETNLIFFRTLAFFQAHLQHLRCKGKRPFAMHISTFYATMDSGLQRIGGKHKT